MSGNGLDVRFQIGSKHGIKVIWKKGPHIRITKTLNACDLPGRCKLWTTTVSSCGSFFDVPYNQGKPLACSNPGRNLMICRSPVKHSLLRFNVHPVHVNSDGTNMRIRERRWIICPIATRTLIVYIGWIRRGWIRGRGRIRGRGWIKRPGWTRRYG